MSTLSRIGAIVFKEVRQLSRDRLTFAMIVMIPLVQLLLFGYAINTDVRDIPVGLVDQSQTQNSRWLTQAVRASQVVSFEVIYPTPQQAKQAIQTGEIRAAMVIPHDLNQRLEQGRVLAQWLVDGSDSVIGSTIMKLQRMPFTPFDKLANASRESSLLSAHGTQPIFDIALFYNPSRRSAVNIVPGLLGVILTMTMVLFTSIAIVRERERGNLELLITTPIHPIELMVGKIIPYIFVGLIQVVLVLGLGHFVFSVPINGSLFQVFIGSLLFISASLSLGLIISTLAQSQLQAMQMTVFILLPSILLSGFMFPYEGMPRAAQWIAEVLPATHFMRLIRGIVLRSANVVELWPDSLWLLAFTLVGIIIAALRFKKSLD